MVYCAKIQGWDDLDELRELGSIPTGDYEIPYTTYAGQ